LTDHIAVEIRKDWHRLAELVTLLQVMLSPRRTLSSVHEPPKSKPPIDLAASALLDEVRFETGFYIKVLVEETGLKAPAQLADKIRVVGDHAGHFLGEEDRSGLDMLDAAQTLISKILGLAMPPLPKTWLGPCSERGCEGQRWLRGDMAICDLCASSQTIGQWREQMRSALETRLVFRREIVPALRILGLKVSLDDVKNWVKRSKIEPEIIEPEMYRLGDVIHVAATHRKRNADQLDKLAI
jgi:hypothetical protein